MSKTSKGFIWQSQYVFVIVAAGATLSLNDFLTFPVLAGQNGGGAFLLLYLLFLFVLGLPLLMIELMLGRVTRADPAASLRTLSNEHKASVYWKLVGLGAMFAGFLIISTFSVVGGWSLAYAVKSMGGAFSDITIEQTKIQFDLFIMDSERTALWHTLFVLSVVSICSRPLKHGLERSFLILVPSMVLLLLVLIILALSSTGMLKSIHYILYADFASMDSSTPIIALQRAFYSLALGVGMMMAFGRYLPKKASIGYSAALVVTVDLLFTIFIALSISALMLFTGQTPNPDSQFAFHVMPVILNHFSSGDLLSALFFLLLTLAALTTSIALLEAPITYLQRKCSINRRSATLYLGFGVWLLGLGIILAQTVWNGEGFTIAVFFGDNAVRLVNNAGFHDVLIFISSHLIQPIAALFLCLFVAWKIPREFSHRAFALSRHYNFEIWNYLVRYIVPVLLLVVILASLGII